MELNADSLKMMIQSGVLRDGYMGIHPKPSSSSHHAAIQGPELVHNLLQVPVNVRSPLDTRKDTTPTMEHNADQTNQPSPQPKPSSRLTLKNILVRFGRCLAASEATPEKTLTTQDVVEIVKGRLMAMDSHAETEPLNSQSQADGHSGIEGTLPQPPPTHAENAPEPLFDPNWTPKGAEATGPAQQDKPAAPQCLQAAEVEEVQTELILSQEKPSPEIPVEQITQRIEALESARETDKSDSELQREAFAQLQSLMQRLEQIQTDHLQWHDSVPRDNRQEEVEALASALKAEQKRWQTQQSELSHMQNLVNRVAQVQTEMTIRQTATAQENPRAKFEEVDSLLKAGQARNEAQQKELTHLQSAIERVELLLTEHSAQLESVSKLNPYPKIEALQTQLAAEEAHGHAQWEELALLHSQVEQLAQRQAEHTLQQTAFAENTSVRSVAERVAALESLLACEQTSAQTQREEFARLQAHTEQLARQQAELAQQQKALAEDPTVSRIEERVRTLESSLQAEQTLTQTQQKELVRLQPLLTRVEQIQTELTERHATALKQTDLIDVEQRIGNLESQLKSEQSRWTAQQEELAQFKALATRIETLQSELNVERESGKLLVHWLHEAERKLAAPPAPIQTHAAPAISPPRKSYFLVSPRENGRGVDRLSPNGL